MALTFDFATRQWYNGPANPDTSGNAAAGNENEINELKATLRDAGVIVPA